jgi:hypothetical protein
MAEARGAFGVSFTPSGPVGVTAGAVSGLWAGAVGGVVMIGLMMVLYGIGTLGFWTPPKVIGAMLLGPAAIGGGAVIFGLFWHMVLAMGFGALFGAGIGLFVGRKLPVPVTAVLGIAYSMLIWAVSQLAMLPAIAPVVANALVPWIFRFGLVLYGLALGAVPASYQRDWYSKYLPW